MNESWLHPSIEIRNSQKGGKGMFATADIKKGEKVLVWGGEYVSREQASKEIESGKLVMQWDDDLFSVEDVGDDEAYYLNHSCEPNLWMTDAYSLEAMRDITVGEELTADYVFWESDEDYVSAWSCRCGTKNCRGKVSGKDWRIEKIQKKYKGHFSPLINKRIKGI